VGTKCKVKNMSEVEKKLKELKINPRLLAGNDTVVRCPKCGRTQALLFKNGLKNGWSTCCGGLTMPIIYHQADVYDATKMVILEQIVKEASLCVDSSSLKENP
jgi:hypothetical protein